MWVRVRGRVQGVGFRFYVCEEAAARGLSGWVRNCPDGSVEAQADGSHQSLQELVELMRKGPRGSHVTACEVTWMPELPGTNSGGKAALAVPRFRIRY